MLLERMGTVSNVLPVWTVAGAYLFRGGTDEVMYVPFEGSDAGAYVLPATTDVGAYVLPATMDVGA